MSENHVIEMQCVKFYYFKLSELPRLVSITAIIIVYTIISEINPLGVFMIMYISEGDTLVTWIRV